MSTGKHVSKDRLPTQVYLRLQSVYDTLKRAERSAADLLLVAPEFVAQSAIGVVAECAGVSQPTLVRFAKRLGFSGFAGLRDELRSAAADSSSTQRTPYEHINTDSKPFDIAQSIVYASIEALNGLLKVMNPLDYERTADALLKAEKIVFLGVGDSGIVASSAYQKFIRVGAVCHTATDVDTQMALAALLCERDVCVLISHSGDTASIVQAARYAKAAGATTIAVTNFPYSHLARICDIILLTATFVERGGEVVTQRVAQLAIVESLFIIYRLRGGEEIDETYDMTERLFYETNKL